MSRVLLLTMSHWQLVVARAGQCPQLFFPVLHYATKALLTLHSGFRLIDQVVNHAQPAWWGSPASAAEQAGRHLSRLEDPEKTKLIPYTTVRHARPRGGLRRAPKNSPFCIVQPKLH